METTGKVQVVARRWGCTTRELPTAENGRLARKARGVIWCDEPGVGGGGLDRLQELGYVVEGFNGGRAPRAGHAQHAFLNERAAAEWGPRRQVEAGANAVPADPHPHPSPNPSRPYRSELNRLCARPAATTDIPRLDL